MIENKTFIAIIPARGGSKRLPKKNILPLAGKPLIAWTIEAAKKSKYIDRIVVSTEDKDIINVCQNYLTEVVERPIHLATDDARTIDAVKHVIHALKERYEYIVLLQPTSPLRNEKHIDQAIELLINKNADAVISVCEVDHPPQWCNTLPEDNSMENFLQPEVINLRSQDLPNYYRINGAIYICKTELLLQKDTFFIDKNIFAYIMPKEYSVDIDTYLDFKFAELLVKEFNSNKANLENY